VGRKSLAESFYNSVTVKEPQETSTWIVLYDFHGIKPNSRFWYNLKRLAKLAGDGSLVQYSVFMTRSKRGALTAVKLAEHYGAEVLLIKGEVVVI
jgi:hypothetical protein